jgi:hypothetical protein
MSQIMEFEIRDLSFPDSELKRSTKIPVGLPVLFTEYSISSLDSNRLQSMGQHRIHGNTASLTVFSVGCPHRHQPLGKATS